MKYGNVRTSGFASKLEKAVYDLFSFREASCEGPPKSHQDIALIECQKHIKMTDAQILYIVDFSLFFIDGHYEYVEAKGAETEVWKLKKKLWKFYGPGPLHIYKGTYRRPVLTETIYPSSPFKELKKSFPPEDCL